ncbi:hypothetical protein DFH09DRAFT_195473 [Mycena vulgaris]|nr:hypothetical protein DFH09DRAFT_195473 [Mycena vulgaris]
MSLPQSQVSQPGSSETFTDANSPFSGEEETDGVPTDLILRTANRVDFHVHKAIMSFVSPVFRDMLGEGANIFQPDEFKNGKPIVRVHDPSSALERLLPVCYPFLANTQSRTNTLDGVGSALVAADKYQIPAATAALLATLQSFLGDEPYRVFAIALRIRLEDIVHAAALATLEKSYWDKREEILEFPPEWSAQILLKLYDFRAECATKAAELCAEYGSTILTEELDPIGIHTAVWWSGSEGHGEGCGTVWEDPYPDDHHAPTLISPAKWFIEHMKEVAKAVAMCPTERGVKTAVMNMRGAMYDLSKCSKCNERAKIDLGELVFHQLAAKVTASNLEIFRKTKFNLD